ncbi:glycosyltransferase [Vibrio sp. 10N.261.54.A5]|uniref:glycosyltransferase n=1 Tax=Vibrio sp. 10N.261.54.A5 TaxID=3229686 RepID=UPI00354AE090
MKKAIHIINAMQVGGVEVGVLSLLKSKSNTDYKVMAVKGCDEDLYNSLTEDEKSRLYICGGYINAIRFLIKLKPKTIVSSLWRAHLVSLIYKLITPKIKRVHFVHNAGFGHFINNTISQLSIYMADFIFTDSSESKEWFEHKMRRKGAVVVPMNVSFSNAPKEASFDPLTFVFVGRFCKQKNLHQSIDFIKNLNTLGLNATFDLYGRDDGELDNLLTYISEQGMTDVVTVHGNVLPTKIEDEMKNYNYYLQSSLAEGMAISVYQAIKNGLIAVINPVGEMQHYTRNGVNAFYLNLDDIPNSANKFNDIFSNGKIKEINVGYIVNKKSYPNFDVSFFEEVNKL